MRKQKRKKEDSHAAAVNNASSAPESPHREVSHLLLLGCLTLLIVILFSYTVSIRRPWFGVLSMEHHQWLTGSTMKYARNWYREGAWNLRFLLLDNPRSVEFPTIGDRGIYISYPPGTILPIYAISLLSRHEPSAPMIMGYNLATQLLLALVLAFTVYFLLIRLLHRVYAVLFAAIPALCVLLLPSPLYWFQNVYFSDQAVILPYALLLFSEVLRDGTLTPRQRRVLDVLQGLILFFGFLTDWLFVFLGVIVFAKRVLLGQNGRTWRAFLLRSLAFWAGPALALGLFAWQLAAFNCWKLLFDRYALRTGNSDDARKMMQSTGFFDQYWKGAVGNGLGAWAVYLLWGCLLICCLAIVWHLGRRIGRWRTGKVPESLQNGAIQLVALMSMTLLPTFIEIYFFKNHSWVHDFAALKMLLPFSLVPFVLLPGLAAAPVEALGLPHAASTSHAAPVRLHAVAVAGCTGVYPA